jgi:hypothetical protein
MVWAERTTVGASRNQSALEIKKDQDFDRYDGNAPYTKHYFMSVMVTVS